MLACEQALGVCTSNFTVLPPFDISIFYTKYLAHNLGSANKRMTNITLVYDFLTFSILNYKNYIHMSIKLQFNNRNTKYQNKIYWQDVSKACLQALISVIIGERKNT